MDDYSQLEELEPRQFPTATFPIPAEVATITTPQDLTIEASALRGQMDITDELFTSSLPLLSGSSMLPEVQQGIDNARTQLSAMDDLVREVQGLDQEEQSKSATIRQLQTAYDTASNAFTAATQKLQTALNEQKTAKDAADLLATQIPLQQSVVDTAQLKDDQKISLLRSATTTLTTDTKNYQNAVSAYSLVHQAFLLAQTAYQKTPNNKLVKAAYDLALTADTKAKQTQDAALQKMNTSQTAYNTAEQNKKHADTALDTAKNSLADMKLQKITADRTYTEKTAQVTTAQNELATATTTKTTAKSDLDTEIGKDDLLKQQIHAFLVDARITAAINAVHDSAALLANDLEKVTQEQANENLAAELGASIQRALEADENKVKYAKMYVSIEDLPTTDTRLHIHFRNPGQQTILKLRMEGKNQSDIIATEPTADGYGAITFRPGDGYNGGFIVQLVDGETGQIIQEVQGSYDRYGKSARIDTQQLPFETEEAGMLSENAIIPSIAVGKIQGTTLLVVAQTPHDQYIVTSDMSGLLSTDPESSPGGTSFGLSQITVNTSRPTGDYQIFLLESQGGRILDTIPFHFDHNSRAITLLNGSDMYNGSVDETDTAQQLQAMQALNNVPLGLANLEIATTQRLRLYQNTADLAAPYNIYVTAQAMLDKLYAAPFFAQFAPQNQEVEVQKFMEAGGTYTSHGVTGYNMSYTQAQDSIIRGRQERVRNYNTYLSTYETAMSECMQAAVNIFLAITKGDPEDTVRSTFDETWNRWSTNGALNPLQAIGITFPSRDTFIGAAKMMFQKEWRNLVTAQADVVQAREREEFWLSKGMYEKANGEWAMATNEHTPIKPPESMSPEQIRLAAKILRIIDSSTDPRIRALTTSRQQQVALQIGAITTTDPEEVKEKITVIVKNAGIASFMDELAKKYPGELFASGWTTDGISSSSYTPDIFDYHSVISLNQSEELSLPPAKSILRSFTITQDSMVNISLAHDLGIALNDRSVHLSIFNPSMEKPWSSNKTGLSANTISASFPAGTYYITVTTDPDASGGSSYSTPSLTKLDFHIDVEKKSTAVIEGVISLEGSAKVFPINMMVAKFDGITGERIYDINELPELNPNKPIHVVIHGRTDRPDSENINGLAKSIYLMENNDNFQVITVDWRDAAKDVSTIMGYEVGLDDASWTPAVGKWVAQQLLNIGFKASNIFLEAHSHGSYAAFFAAQHIIESTTSHDKVGGIIALDSAKNPIFIGANIKEEDIKFNDVANYSLALHSSFLGSVNRSLSAQNTILVGTQHGNVNMVKQHGDSVNAITDLLHDLKNGVNKNITDVFSFSPTLGLRLKVLTDSFGYDALLTIQDEISHSPDWNSLDVTGISLRKNTGDWADLIVDPSHIPSEGVNYKPSSILP